MEKIIKFYNTDKPYGCFSNFDIAPFYLDGYKWRTSEHYFQAMKFVGTEHYNIINKTEKPMTAAKIGRDRTRPLRRDWEEVKDDIMYQALKAKFDSNEDLRKILLSTGDATLIEHTSNDSYWGDGGDGNGKNMLGALLMRLRESYDEYDGEFFLPQWLINPDKHPMDMFWRMGVGESYVYKIYLWHQKWGDKAFKEFEKYYVAPDGWTI